MIMKRIKQINNIIILENNGTFFCKHRNIVYEQFLDINSAENWCRNTLDFLSH